MAKKSFPLSKVYRLIEPGPVVMVNGHDHQKGLGKHHDHVVAHHDGF